MHSVATYILGSTPCSHNTTYHPYKRPACLRKEPPTHHLCIQLPHTSPYNLVAYTTPLHAVLSQFHCSKKSNPLLLQQGVDQSFTLTMLKSAALLFTCRWDFPYVVLGTVLQAAVQACMAGCHMVLGGTACPLHPTSHQQAAKGAARGKYTLIRGR
jgi:hypothetical protein